MISTLSLIVALLSALAGAAIAWALTRSAYIRINKYAKDGYEQRLSELKEANEKALSDQLKTIKAQMEAQSEALLKARQKELSEENSARMGDILNPLKESIDKMQKAMKDNADEHLKSTAVLSENLKKAVADMQEKTAAIGTKADNLSEALTGRSKIQGCWGENLLDDILAKEGLTKGLHYSREEVNSEGTRPDFVFHFMEGDVQKDLVVDSKVSLTAYVSYVNAKDDESRKAALQEHLRSIHKHIDELSRKDYYAKIDKDKRFADYVLMFMPIDMALRTAIDAEPVLWQEAYQKGVLIATEQTIMPFLKIIQLTWNKHRQDSNIQKITSAAQAMIDRVAAFYDSYTSLGKKLRSVCNEYNDGIVKLKDDGRSITTSAKQVISIGSVRPSKGRELTIPEDMISGDGPSGTDGVSGGES